jgi:hypothetical protein
MDKCALEDCDIPAIGVCSLVTKGIAWGMIPLCKTHIKEFEHMKSWINSYLTAGAVHGVID